MELRAQLSQFYRDYVRADKLFFKSFTRCNELVAVAHAPLDIQLSLSLSFSLSLSLSSHLTGHAQPLTYIVTK